ncbi:hypothetical protein TIFTF001_038544 [Ficus carica]|uniref:Uncharacterized protein n=1 Tax=Ficus carica TaxID=3494 RepID=A0AA88E7F5_FICCA|nr:hypothetical protein TIFTF001_038544 [Ficus carica]
MQANGSNSICLYEPKNMIPVIPNYNMKPNNLNFAAMRCYEKHSRVSLAYQTLKSIVRIQAPPPLSFFLDISRRRRSSISEIQPYTCPANRASRDLDQPGVQAPAVKDVAAGAEPSAPLAVSEGFQADDAIGGLRSRGESELRESPEVARREGGGGGGGAAEARGMVAMAALEGTACEEEEEEEGGDAEEEEEEGGYEGIGEVRWRLGGVGVSEMFAISMAV